MVMKLTEEDKSLMKLLNLKILKESQKNIMLVCLSLEIGKVNLKQKKK